MAEFQTEYYTPMDRGYHAPEEFESIRPTANIEEPIFPITQLGQTVPEHDPSGRFKNILQNVQAAIRGGTGNLQLVFMTPIENPLGGRPKAYGEEVRQALKEVAMANEVMVTGMEMPTSLNNLSGLDMQRGIVDEEKRQRDLDEVKEMVKFAADVGRGGGVDIVSWEYDRPLNRATWLEDDKTAKKAFSKAIATEAKKEEVRFVDVRSGQIGSIPIREGIPMFLTPGTFEEIDPLKKKPVLWGYKEFEKFAKHKGMPVHELIKKHFLEEQKATALAQEAYYTEQYRHALDTVKRWDEVGEELEKRGQNKQYFQNLANSYLAGLQEQVKMQMQNQLRIENWKLLEEETVRRSKESYAEAGITAMQTQDTRGPKNITKDLYVGPEIGWPAYYGSHPKEFVDMILGARETMVKILTNDKEFAGKYKEFGIKQPMSRSAAEQEARTHVKGTFDTSHMGMWLQQFHPEMPWDKRLKEFKKWYGEQIEWLADQNKKHDVIGAVQAVDSAGAGHGHLPPGQGILPVKDALETLKLKGKFNGYVLSEGHEEEKFGEGRILLKTWEHFQAPLVSRYTPGFPQQRWLETRGNYFARTYSPMFMFGAYAPSNEFKLWSEVPLE